MGIFGWSYPPGCSGPPEYEEEPCAICGAMPDNCICPECDVVVDSFNGKDILCGVYGCLEHMDNRMLTNLIELRDCQLRQLKDEAKKREITTAPCPICRETQQITIMQDYAPYCCGYEWWKDSWIDV